MTSLKSPLSARDRIIAARITTQGSVRDALPSSHSGKAIFLTSLSRDQPSHPCSPTECPAPPSQENPDAIRARLLIGDCR